MRELANIPGGRRGGRRSTGPVLICLVAALLPALLATSAQAAVATPTLTTFASSSSVAVGTPITDTALLVGGSSAPATPTGKITFQVYGPNDAKCAGTPAFTSTVAYALPTMSGAFTPTKAGSYSFVASYPGDANNAKAASGCADPGEQVTVTPLNPTLTTVASPSVTVGGSVSDTAVLAGAYKPTGSITFRLYGVNDPSCAGTPVFTSTAAVATPTLSGGYNAPAAGTYRFVASYSGDAANTPAKSGCGDPTEAVVVTPAAPKAPPPVACNSAAMAQALVNSLVAALTGAPGSSFKATCSAGVRIVLRAKEIRPGNPGFPRRDGFTTMVNTLTHTSSAGQIAFTYNAQGVALRNYAASTGASLVVFAIVHVRPDRSSQSSEAIQIFNLH